MKILWVTNIPIGRNCELTNTNSHFGGWMTSLLELMKGIPSVEIFVVTPWNTNRKLQICDLNINYIIIPGGQPIHYKHKNKHNILIWKQLISEIKPDIIHIHGTEFSPGLALMNACPKEKYVISIQGLIGVIERYYYAGIDLYNFITNITLHDILRFDTPILTRIKYQKRAVRENEYLTKTEHVIGRTTWDYVHTKTINENVNYHFCNEILRSAFYDKNWRIGTIKRHSIFISQAGYPIKGFHFVLKALNIIKQKYNDVKVYVAGPNILNSQRMLDKFRLSGYEKYINKLVKEYNLREIIEFTGSLNANQMVSKYLHSHLFICPSSIENSPNSIGEAQLIGTPCIASYVGGIPDIIKDGETGLLYRFEEYEILAYNISRIFNDDDFASRLSKGAQEAAAARHNKKKNFEELISIYNKVVED